MPKEKPVKKRTVRHCTVCGQVGHRSDFHGTREERNRVILGQSQTMEPDQAMRVMIQPFYASWLVSEGKIGEALSNATKALAVEKHPVAGDALLIALAELESRARKLDPTMLAELRELRKKRDEADAAFKQVEATLTNKLGYKAGT